MNQALWGLLSALSLGTADFLARYSSRAVGADRALFGVFVVSCLVLTGTMILDGRALSVDLAHLWLPVLFGALTTLAMLLLYQALALGPISLAAPIVAAHPALVVVFAVLLGSRPDALQWLAIVATMVGALIVARYADHEAETVDGGAASGPISRTIVVASGACVAYAAMVIAGQHAVPVYGDLETIWVGRFVSLVTLLALLLVRRQSPTVPVRLWLLIGVQGSLDAAGFLFLLKGSDGEFAEIAAVVSACFGAVTILLALIILRERLTLRQWFGVLIVFAGVAVLSSR